MTQLNCPIGTVLEFLQACFSAGFNPLHPEGLRGGYSGLPHTSWWSVSGKGPPGYTFLCGVMRLRPLAREAYAIVWFRMLFYSLESSDLPSPLGVKAHSTRSVAASKAFLAGVPMQDICNAAGWSTPLTFVRFYDLDLRATPGSSVLLP